MKGQQKLFGPWPDALPAIGEFKLKFYDKTRNHWEERHNFQTHANKYTWIEMDYEDDSDKKSAVCNQTLTNTIDSVVNFS